MAVCADSEATANHKTACLGVQSYCSQICKWYRPPVSVSAEVSFPSSAVSAVVVPITSVHGTLGSATPKI